MYFSTWLGALGVLCLTLAWVLQLLVGQSVCLWISDLLDALTIYQYVIISRVQEPIKGRMNAVTLMSAGRGPWAV
ncbi:hypothetical protein BGX38DRAFT_1245537, partial [Terfezia claveryi]